MATKYIIDEHTQLLLETVLEWTSLVAELQVTDDARDAVIAVARALAVEFGIPVREITEEELPDGSVRVTWKDTETDSDTEIDSEPDPDSTVH